MSAFVIAGMPLCGQPNCIQHDAPHENNSESDLFKLPRVDVMQVHM